MENLSVPYYLNSCNFHPIFKFYVKKNHRKRGGWNLETFFVDFSIHFICFFNYVLLIA